NRLSRRGDHSHGGSSWEQHEDGETGWTELPIVGNGARACAAKTMAHPREGHPRDQTCRAVELLKESRSRSAIGSYRGPTAVMSNRRQLSPSAAPGGTVIRTSNRSAGRQVATRSAHSTNVSPRPSKYSSGPSCKNSSSSLMR